MPDPLRDERQPLRDEPRARLQLIQKHKDSNTILAIVMAGIASGHLALVQPLQQFQLRLLLG